MHCTNNLIIIQHLVTLAYNLNGKTFICAEYGSKCPNRQTFRMQSVQMHIIECVCVGFDRQPLQVCSGDQITYITIIIIIIINILTIPAQHGFMHYRRLYAILLNLNSFMCSHHILFIMVIIFQFVQLDYDIVNANILCIFELNLQRCEIFALSFFLFCVICLYYSFYFQLHAQRMRKTLLRTFKKKWYNFAYYSMRKL